MLPEAVPSPAVEVGHPFHQKDIGRGWPVSPPEEEEPREREKFFFFFSSLLLRACISSWLLPNREAARERKGKLQPRLDDLVRA